MTYRVNEIFYSIQGEGQRVGTPNIFLRFSGCNLTCNRKEHGFDCDTEFRSGDTYTSKHILEWMDKLADTPEYRGAVILTGGEPLLQYDAELSLAFKQRGITVCAESNGTVPLKEGAELDYLSVSPKTAIHTLDDTLRPDEVRVVRAEGQPLKGFTVPWKGVRYWYVSPAWVDGDMAATLRNVRWCEGLVKQASLRRDPRCWRMSIQQHKLIGVR